MGTFLSNVVKVIDSGDVFHITDSLYREMVDAIHDALAGGRDFATVEWSSESDHLIDGNAEYLYALQCSVYASYETEGDGYITPRGSYLSSVHLEGVVFSVSRYDAGSGDYVDMATDFSESRLESLLLED